MGCLDCLIPALTRESLAHLPPSKTELDGNSTRGNFTGDLMKPIWKATIDKIYDKSVMLFTLFVLKFHSIRYRGIKAEFLKPIISR